MMKIAFVTLGCKLNYAETSTYERGFVREGFEVVSWREKADVYLVNTCTVTETSNRKSRSDIRKLHRINPDAPIIVTGCYAELRREEILAIEGVAAVFGCYEKNLVVPKTMELLGGEGVRPGGEGLKPMAARGLVNGGTASEAQRWDEAKRKVSAPPRQDALTSPEVLPLEADSHRGSCEVFAAYSSGERTRSFLKVQDGCDNFCAYCTVPFARGRSRNIPICEAVRMAREIAAQGIREIVLTGVNTGDFGRTTGESFLDLLKALDGVEGIERYRISSIEPNLLSEEIIDWIASGTKFQPHFHIPLQTGCDELLERMGRHYDTAFFERKLDSIRSRMEGPGKPEVFFGIDVMVGLPGETEEMFLRTRDFIERIHPAFIHIFPYSVRPGTRAAKMDGQVPEEVKAARVKSLEQLCDNLHADFVRRHEGMLLEVLFESKEKGGTMGGYTQNYIRVTRPFDPSKVGRIVEETV